MIDGSKLFDNIRQVQRPSHDIVYCSREQKDALGKEMFKDTNSGRMFEFDSLTVQGLEVVQLDGIEVPIVCKRGQVFPIAEEYK